MKMTGADTLLSFSSCPIVLDVFEWVGDAILEEIVSRCLLVSWVQKYDKIHHKTAWFSPLLRRLVSNATLARMAKGSQVTYLPARKVKAEADKVEAFLGYAIFHAPSSIDELVSTVFQLQQHTELQFQKSTKAVHWNVFEMLGNDDEEEDDIVEKEDGEKEQEEDGKEQEKDHRKLPILNNKVAETEIQELETNIETTFSLPHYSVNGTVVWEQPLLLSTTLKELFEMETETMKTLMTSCSDYDMFRVYGTSVVNTLVSIGLHQLLHLESRTTSSTLTVARQTICCRKNLADQATFLGLLRDHETELENETKCANGYRALIGHMMLTPNTSQKEVVNVLIAHLVYSVQNEPVKESVVGKCTSFELFYTKRWPNVMDVMLRQDELPRSFKCSETLVQQHVVWAPSATELLLSSHPDWNSIAEDFVDKKEKRPSRCILIFTKGMMNLK